MHPRRNQTGDLLELPDTVMMPSQALDMPWPCWTCDSSNSDLDKSISFVGNLRIEQDSPDSLQVGTPIGPILDRSLELKEAVNAQPIIFKYGLPRSYELMQ